MPTRNVVRVFTEDTFYHIYNRGHNRDLLFLDEQDYDFFISLLARCFGPEQVRDAKGKLLPWFGDLVSLNAFCLMPNHFHLLLHQHESETAISKAMQSLGTTYSMYFNKKYQKRGTVFESVFKSCTIYNDMYLQHITRYIHLNPKSYRTYPYSTYQAYLGKLEYQWVKKEEILRLFSSVEEYAQFVTDYEALIKELSSIKYELADHGEAFNNT